MTILPLVYAPDPIFKKKAESVGKVDAAAQQIMDDMMETLKAEHGIGMAAPMVGILKRIVVVNLTEDGKEVQLQMANPQVIESSKETQVYLEASLCFPGVSADVTRPKYVKVSYLDYDGNKQEMEAEGFLATVLQHEIDYLDGKVFLDYLSKLKRDTMMRKMQKYMKQHGHHVHGPNCNH